MLGQHWRAVLPPLRVAVEAGDRCWQDGKGECWVCLAKFANSISPIPAAEGTDFPFR